MHDANGLPLAVGDRVLIPAVVTEVFPTDDFCNVSVATAAGRRPDGQKEKINAINTGVMYRDNDGDHALRGDLHDPAPGGRAPAAIEPAAPPVVDLTSLAPGLKLVHAVAIEEGIVAGVADDEVNIGPGETDRAAHDEDHGGTPHDD